MDLYEVGVISAISGKQSAIVTLPGNTASWKYLPDDMPTIDDIVGGLAVQG